MEIEVKDIKVKLTIEKFLKESNPRLRMVFCILEDDKEAILAERIMEYNHDTKEQEIEDYILKVKEKLSTEFSSMTQQQLIENIEKKIPLLAKKVNSEE